MFSKIENCSNIIILRQGSFRHSSLHIATKLITNGWLPLIRIATKIYNQYIT